MSRCGSPTVICQKALLAGRASYAATKESWALRERIGDTAFFKLLPAWTKLHRYGNANTADFIGLAEKVSGQQLDDLFHTWLFTTGKPAR